MSRSADLAIHARRAAFPLAQPFVISRGAKSTAETLVVTVTRDGVAGRGEAVPYTRYGETMEAALHAVASAAHQIRDRSELRERLPAGAARNALDCAFIDLEAKARGVTAAAVLGLGEPVPVQTAYTLSLDAPEAMAQAACAVPQIRLVKLKLGGGAADRARMLAVRAARPDARLVADANEAWSPADLPMLMEAAREARFELVEQPLPAGGDEALAGVSEAFPDVIVCADESVHTAADVAALTDRYRAVNVKLDKAGGLTEALETVAAARSHGLKVMVGSMVASSLAIAPAVLLAQGAEWADLDSPLLLARDCDNLLAVDGDMIAPASPALWG